VERALGRQGGKRAERIARTETTGALNAGHQASRDRLQELGLVKGKQWLAVVDDHTRLEHAAADGQEVAVREDFRVGEERAALPGDHRLFAGQRIYCRCTVVSVPAGDG
jgi:uncharacterized protein with gpF-like domain